MWVILTILFMSTSFVLFIINIKTSTKIKALEYTINTEVKKAFEEWKRYKQ